MNSCGRRFKNKNRENLSVMLTAFAFGCVDSSLDDAKGHSEPDDTERIPETAVKYHMAHIPYPFKRKRKHINSSLPAGL